MKIEQLDKNTWSLRSSIRNYAAYTLKMVVYLSRSDINELSAVEFNGS
jgi:hypothetical protein